MLITTPSVKYQVETFSEIIDDVWPLMLANHQETGVYDRPLNPDFDRLFQLEAIGQLLLMTVRADDIIIAYSVYFLDTEIFDKGVVAASQSTFFVDKKHRGIGYTFMRFCDDILKSKGVNSVWRQASAKFDISVIYKRAGYSLIEMSYLKRF